MVMFSRPCILTTGRGWSFDRSCLPAVRSLQSLRGVTSKQFGGCQCSLMNRARRRAPRNLCNDRQCHGQRVVVSGGPDKQTDSCNLKQEQTEQIVGPGRSQLVVINKLSTNKLTHRTTESVRSSSIFNSAGFSNGRSEP